MTSIESRISILTQNVAEERRLLEAQLAKSTAARTASAAALSISTSQQAAPSHRSAPQSQNVSSPLSSSSSPLASPSSPSGTRSTAMRPSQPSASPIPSSPVGVVVVAPLADTHREGTLLHLVRSGGLFGAGGSPSLVPHYVVVSGSTGISWYASQSDFRSQPQRPLGHADFWIETFNSRGSRFKKAAVCWPLILPEDCPAATDPSKTYFAVDYYTAGGSREQVVFAASSSEERDAWVRLLTKYIDLYLAPRAESEELQHITRGAAVPMHRSGVIEGEAPGGNIL